MLFHCLLLLTLGCQGSEEPGAPLAPQTSIGGATTTAGTATTTADVTTQASATTLPMAASTSSSTGVATTGAGATTTGVASSMGVTSTNASGTGGASTMTNSVTTGAGGTAGSTGTTASDPGTEGDGDYSISPPYTDSPDLDNSDVPHGNTYEFTMSSEMSDIYRGDDTTLNNPQSFSRAVRVYVPAQYVDGTPAPLMVVQDGYVADIERALDVLIVEGSVPALVLVFVANGGGDSKGSQRGLEYDTLSDRYSRFITSEVLPAVASNTEVLADFPNFSFTADPEGRGAYGCSSGGAAAFTMGWFTPDQFRRIITYSGTFVDQQDDDAAEEAQYPLGAWEYHERLIAENDVKPLRVFLHVGEDDLGAGEPESTYHNWVMANERMAAALAAKGYHYRFVYAEGSGHCDSAVRRQTLPDVMRWMWRGYQ